MTCYRDRDPALPVTSFSVCFILSYVHRAKFMLMAYMPSMFSAMSVHWQVFKSHFISHVACLVSSEAHWKVSQLHFHRPHTYVSPLQITWKDGAAAVAW